MSPQQQKALRDIGVCLFRTAALGGHVEECDHSPCSQRTIAYNSCRNRHSPQVLSRPLAIAWLAERAQELLPVPYCHVVFTVPQGPSRHWPGRTNVGSIVSCFAPFLRRC